MGNSKKNNKTDNKKNNNIIEFRGRNNNYSDYNEDNKRVFWIEENIRLLVLIGIIAGVIFILLFAAEYILEKYTVSNVIVEGNQHYSAAEIRSMVEKGKFGDNTIYLSLKYKNKSITDIPFIQKMDVSVVDRNTVKISVYEKKMAGFVEYIGSYLYFDKDGIVVESSNVKTAGIPMVSGLSFDHFVMYEQLPVDDVAVFQTVLDVTQLLNKYDISAERIYFDKNNEMTLFFGEVRVGMGEMNLLEEKVQRLTGILPSLVGEKGYLEMSTYDSGKEDFTFTKDK